MSNLEPSPAVANVRELAKKRTRRLLAVMAALVAATAVAVLIAYVHSLPNNLLEAKKELRAKHLGGFVEVLRIGKKQPMFGPSPSSGYYLYYQDYCDQKSPQAVELRKILQRNHVGDHVFTGEATCSLG